MRVAALIATIFMTLVSGCTKPRSPAPPPVAISGKVVFGNGKPVTNMVISLHPKEEQNAGNRPSGHVDKDGKYALSAIPGRYKVTLLAIPAHGGSAGAADLPMPQKGDPKDVFNPMTRYRDAQNSPLELTVPAMGGEIQTLTVN